MGYSLFLTLPPRRLSLRAGRRPRHSLRPSRASSSDLPDRAGPCAPTRPAILPFRFGASASCKRAAMLLGDALHDGEAKARAFGARGHVGLDQPLAVLLGQPAAIVDHGDLQPVALGAHLGDDVALSGARRARLRSPCRSPRSHS